VNVGGTYIDASDIVAEEAGEEVGLGDRDGGAAVEKRRGLAAARGFFEVVGFVVVRVVAVIILVGMCVRTVLFVRV